MISIMPFKDYRTMKETCDFISTDLFDFKLRCVSINKTLFCYMYYIHIVS